MGERSRPAKWVAGRRPATSYRGGYAWLTASPFAFPRPSSLRSSALARHARLALVAGTLLQRAVPRPLVRNPQVSRLLGWPLVAAGVAIAAWAVRTMGATNATDPPELVTTGPYAASRNPMYVAWTLGYAGLALLLNSRWLAVLLAPALAVTHGTVRREEHALEEAFGDEYREYWTRVRRYL